MLKRLAFNAYRLTTKRYYVFIVLGAAFIVRMLWVCMFDAKQLSDFAWYLERALLISAGTGYVENGVPTAYRPIGYPAFLGGVLYLVHNSLFFAKLVHVALSICTIYIFYKLAMWITASKGIAGTAILMLALYPNQIAYSSLFASEIPFVFFILLAIYYFVLESRRSMWLSVLSGIFFAAAIMIKPIALFAPLILIFMYKGGKNRIVTLALVYIPIFILVGLWTYRNYTIYHAPIFSTSNVGVNLFIGNNPYANGTYRYDKTVTALIGSPINELIEGKLAQQYALEYISRHPLKSVALIPLKIVHFFLRDYEAVSANYHGMEGTDCFKIGLLKFLIFFSQAYYIVVMVLSVIGLWLSRKKLFHQYKLAAFFILYFVGIYIPFFGCDRFHYPVMPFLMLFSALAVDKFLKGRGALSQEYSSF